MASSTKLAAVIDHQGFQSWDVTTQTAAKPRGAEGWEKVTCKPAELLLSNCWWCTLKLALGSAWWNVSHPEQCEQLETAGAPLQQQIRNC